MSKTTVDETNPADPETIDPASETNPPAGDTTAAPAESNEAAAEPAGLDLQAMAAKHPMAEQDDPDICNGQNWSHLQQEPNNAQLQ